MLSDHGLTGQCSLCRAALVCCLVNLFYCLVRLGCCVSLAGFPRIPGSP